MYAVIEVKGMQYRVQKDDKIFVNRLSGGDEKKIKVDTVLFAKDGAKYFVGEPYIKDAYVECEIIAEKRAKKVISFKYRERKSSQSKHGHRTDLTELKIKNIHLG